MIKIRYIPKDESAGTSATTVQKQLDEFLNNNSAVEKALGDEILLDLDRLAKGIDADMAFHKASEIVFCAKGSKEARDYEDTYEYAEYVINNAGFTILKNFIVGDNGDAKVLVILPERIYNTIENKVPTRR